VQRVGVEVRLGISQREIRVFSSQEVRVCLGEGVGIGIDVRLGFGVLELAVRIGLWGMDVIDTLL